MQCARSRRAFRKGAQIGHLMEGKVMDNRTRNMRAVFAISGTAVLGFVALGIAGSHQPKPASVTPSSPASVSASPVSAAPAVTHGTVPPPPKAATVTVVRTAESVQFNVWGSAPEGADITYGSDSINDSPSGDLGPLGNGSAVPFSATLPYGSSALYYDVSAQLQGSGSISCDVDAVVTKYYSDGTHVTHTGTIVTGHASGGYNICSAQSS